MSAGCRSFVLGPGERVGVAAEGVHPVFNALRAG